MDFDSTMVRDVKLSMIPYAKQIEDDFPKPIICTAPTYATEHLLQVQPDDERKFLPKE